MDETEATRLLASTQATTALPRERQRRRLEPLPDDRPPARRQRPEPVPARARRGAPPPRRRGAGLKMWLGLLLVLALIGGGLALYQSVENGVQQGVQLKEDVQGDVQDAVDEVKGLIEDNTR